MVLKSLSHLKRPSGYLNATRATGGNQQIRPRLCGRVAGQIGVLKRSDVAAGEGLKSLSNLEVAFWVLETQLLSAIMTTCLNIFFLG